jgi:hypothetical protein
MEAFSVRSARALRLVTIVAAVVSAFSVANTYAQTPAGTIDQPHSAAGARGPDVRGPFAPASLETSDPAATRREELEAARIIARVGDDVILAGDLLGQVNQFLHQRIQQIAPAERNSITPEMLNEQRWKLMEQLLPQSIQGKLMYLDFRRSIPEERLPDIQDSLYQAFDEKQLPVLIERANVKSAADLDQLLRTFGSSLSQQRLTFAEQLAAAQWKDKNSTDTREISHEDLLEYYREHKEDYRIPSRARWEQLTAQNSETGSAAESYRLVSKLGNEVWQGASFEAVAKRSSHGPTASLGGQYDWTTKGSLRSQVLEEALFSLPTGRLSQRIQDDEGCHIIRVIERQDEHIVPFQEVQEEIRDKIKEARSAAALQKYIAQLREEFPVWSIFEEPEDTRLARRNL